jgi:hypothetical protein
MLGYVGFRNLIYTFDCLYQVVGLYLLFACWHHLYIEINLLGDPSWFFSLVVVALVCKGLNPGC